MSTDLLEPCASAQKAAPGKYLTFILGKESYAIEVLKVREIIRCLEITSVPQMPPYIKGVLNLRGKIIPVLDLRIKFSFPEAATTERTCIIVVQVKVKSGVQTQMGLIVDAVEEVINLAASDMEPTPEFGGRFETEYLLGMAKTKSKVRTLLDIDRVVTADVLDLKPSTVS